MKVPSFRKYEDEKSFEELGHVKIKPGLKSHTFNSNIFNEYLFIFVKHYLQNSV